ncbi:MAG: hypothetical protein V4438_03120 [Patescibacteria group bacterium]
MKNNQKGFAVGIVLIILAVLSITGFGAYKVFHKPVPAAEEQNVPIDNFPADYKPADHANTSSGSANITAVASTWKTYRSDKYEFEFKYPPNWIVNTSSDGTICFKKTAAAPNVQIFACVSASKGFSLGGSDKWNNELNAKPPSVTPQQSFDYYYSHDPRPSIDGEPKLQSIQIGNIPVIRHFVQGDRRYVVYTSDKEINFVLYSGDSQNPTEYREGDGKVMEQVVKSLTLLDPSKSFVKIELVEKNLNWTTYGNSQFEFKYPDTLNTDYASYEQSPTAIISQIGDKNIDNDGCYAGYEIEGKPIISKVSINNISYCLATGGGVGAGQRYYAYDYTTKHDDTYVTLQYVIHTSNGCSVFMNSGDINSPDNKRYNECLDFVKNYDNLVLKPIQESVTTLKFIK